MNTFKNWSKSSYWIYFIGAIILIWLSLSISQIDAYSIVTLIGALFGFLSVVLIVNKNRSAGYVGMVSAIIYMFISWRLGNYSDTLLNVLFIIFLNLPLIFNNNYTEEVAPKSLKGNKLVLESLVAVGAFTFFGLYIFETAVMHAPRPEWSVTAATLGIIASVATSVFVVKEAFWLWTFQNVLQVALWCVTYNQTHSGVALLMMVTYILYTINASTAFFNGKWFKKKTCFNQ